ncbi:MAG: hypothetical protein PHD97_04410 [Bacteroidales bacterium]|nr:hypothetical protein [Bacteroidales bacterium]
MKDFTFVKYKQLIKTIQEHNYQLMSYEEYAGNSFGINDKIVIVRHDVDRSPINALKTAEIENKLGLKCTYYFRVVKESYDETIIKKIVQLGHEIGYHYEDLLLANGNPEKAISLFENNLNKLSEFYKIKTICMHGSPRSKIDNRDIWKNYDYKKYKILAEPYIDLNFSEVFYITDASRKWNNRSATIRDFVNSSYSIPVKSSNDIMELFKNSLMPNKIMINIHPHNWTDSEIEWTKIWLWQSLKNAVKALIISLKK